MTHRDVAPLLSDEHFSVDGTLIKAWASAKSFKPKTGGTPPDGEAPMVRPPKVTLPTIRLPKPTPRLLPCPTPTIAAAMPRSTSRQWPPTTWPYCHGFWQYKGGVCSN